MFKGRFVMNTIRCIFGLMLINSLMVVTDMHGCCAQKPAVPRGNELSTCHVEPIWQSDRDAKQEQSITIIDFAQCDPTPATRGCCSRAARIPVTVVSLATGQRSCFNRIVSCMTGIRPRPVEEVIGKSSFLHQALYRAGFSVAYSSPDEHRVMSTTHYLPLEAVLQCYMSNVTWSDWSGSYDSDGARTPYQLGLPMSLSDHVVSNVFFRVKGGDEERNTFLKSLVRIMKTRSEYREKKERKKSGSDQWDSCPDDGNIVLHRS